MILKENISTSLRFGLATSDRCGIDTFHTCKIESKSFPLHASGSGTPIKTDLNEEAPNYAWPDSKDISYTDGSSDTDNPSH